MTLTTSRAYQETLEAGGAPAPAPAPTAPTVGRPAAARSSRYVWFDILRAIALLKVFVYHFFGWTLLANAIPSMGLMFAMAGSLMASSLTRQKGRHYHVIARRLRRLLPPFWLMGLVVVPLMLWHGWTATVSATPARGSTLWLWILPLSTPPGSDWGLDWVVPLWYIRTYLWFVVLSPPTLWLWRRWPRQVFWLAPILLVLMISGSLRIAASVGDIVLDLATFGSCWLLGFAHHDGHLQAMPWRRILPLGSALVAAGIIWAVVHPSDGSWDVNDIPIADALFSIGGALLLLRMSPSPDRFARHPRLAGFATWVSSRALTMYLWNNVAIWVALVAANAWQTTETWADDGSLGSCLLFAGSCLILALMVVGFGWVEDLAAGRRPRLLPRLALPATAAPQPGGRTAEQAGRTAEQAHGTAVGEALAAPESPVTAVTPPSVSDAMTTSASPSVAGQRPPRSFSLPRPRSVLLTGLAVAGYAAATWGVHWPGATAAKGVIQLAVPPIAPSATQTASPQPQVSITGHAPKASRSPRPTAGGQSVTTVVSPRPSTTSRSTPKVSSAATPAAVATTASTPSPTASATPTAPAATTLAPATVTPTPTPTVTATPTVTTTTAPAPPPTPTTSPTVPATASPSLAPGM